MALAVIMTVVALTSVLFLWPATSTLRPADAIVVLGGTGARQAKGVQLAQRKLAPVLVLSLPDGEKNPACAPGASPHQVGLAGWQRQAIELKATGTKVVCFAPSPISTQGEAEEVGRLAALNGWRDIILVVSSEQATRARVRLHRCYRNNLDVATVPIGLTKIPYTVAYEWGALLKALVWQRSC